VGSKSVESIIKCNNQHTTCIWQKAVCSYGSTFTLATGLRGCWVIQNLWCCRLVKKRIKLYRKIYYCLFHTHIRTHTHTHAHYVTPWKLEKVYTLMFWKLWFWNNTKNISISAYYNVYCWQEINRGPASLVGIATGYVLDGAGIECQWGAGYSAPVLTGPGAQPASCIMGTGSFPGVKSGRSVTLTPYSLLVPWSRRGRARPLLTPWAIRPVQNLSACTKVTFNLPFLPIQITHPSQSTVSVDSWYVRRKT
jgi:hypothetical protein